MAFIMSRFDVGDYDAWKKLFDSDPGGRKQSGKGHRLFRSVDNPSEVFVATEFNTAEDAKAFRERLLASGALNNVTVKTEPTVTEEAESVEY
jgi:heme-degrading monooxygenase HmoA